MLTYGQINSDLMLLRFNDIRSSDEFGILSSIAQLLGRKYIHSIIECTANLELIRLCSIPYIRQHGDLADIHIGLNIAKNTLEIYKWVRFGPKRSSYAYSSINHQFGNTILGNLDLHESLIRSKLRKFVKSAQNVDHNILNLGHYEFRECRFIKVPIYIENHNFVTSMSTEPAILHDYNLRIPVNVPSDDWLIIESNT